eukprot:CAMPEP_0198704522 /NCGR_PEP_ID=MMETSP1468-20131203/389947_1 /TAXON_ID=1461545 /ORGANISM="Mantoniella sp, Strain CCMP1436" /LENGTH=68 /DNA_ID=CAMNT_0044463341 /DNA_START=631 /DNA_END=837 /DNA_ORIENTATION=+
MGPTTSGKKRKHAAAAAAAGGGDGTPASSHATRAAPKVTLHPAPYTMNSTQPNPIPEALYPEPWTPEP